MNQLDIKRIEQALGVKLPRPYAELVTNYPAELRGTDAEGFAFLNDAQTVISENLSVRDGEFYGGIWPPNLLVIGTNGCGDLYVTKLNGDTFSTGFFDHEIPAFVPHSQSAEEFITMLRHESDSTGA